MLEHRVVILQHELLLCKSLPIADEARACSDGAVWQGHCNFVRVSRVGLLSFEPRLTSLERVIRSCVLYLGVKFFSLVANPLLKQHEKNGIGSWNNSGLVALLLAALLCWLLFLRFGCVPGGASEWTPDFELNFWHQDGAVWILWIVFRRIWIVIDLAS